MSILRNIFVVCLVVLALGHGIDLDDLVAPAAHVHDVAAATITPDDATHTHHAHVRAPIVVVNDSFTVVAVTSPAERPFSFPPDDDRGREPHATPSRPPSA